jgi:hypothetical protein
VCRSAKYPALSEEPPIGLRLHPLFVATVRIVVSYLRSIGSQGLCDNLRCSHIAHRPYLVFHLSTSADVASFVFEQSVLIVSDFPLDMLFPADAVDYQLDRNT